MPTTTTGLATSFITFSRPGASGGGATTTDRDGRIKWAGHNLVQHSESFDNSYWLKVGGTISANTTLAPNGTTTADTYSASSGSARHCVLVSAGFGVVSAAQHTASVFIKKGTHNYVTVTFLSLAASGYWTAATVDFSSSTPVISKTQTSASATALTPTIEAAANGFWRVSLTGTLNNSPASIEVALASSATPTYDTYGEETWTAAGTETVIVWGAHCHRADLGGMQLNPAMPAGMQTYYPTTVRNMVGYSEDFSNAYWTKLSVTASAASVTNPAGLNGASLLYPTSTGTDRATYRTPAITGVASTPYTLSVYAKANGINFLYFGTLGGGTSPASTLAFFDLQNGARTQVGTAFTSATITAVGNGWYRCTATASPASGSLFPVFGLADANNSTTVTASGTSGIYLWGAQLSDSASLDTYVPQYGAAVTSAAYYAPRLDFDGATLSPRGLLVEEQRSNLILNSNAPTAGAGITITAGAAVSPDGSTNAYRIAKTDATDPRYFSRATSMTTVAGRTYTVSAWFKYDGFNTVVSLEYNSLVNWDVAWNAQFTVASTGVTTAAASNCTHSVQNVGNGWYRAIVTFTAGAAPTVTSNPAILTRVTGGSGVTVLGYGGQIEENASFATSYIPTGSATATRAADVASVSTSAFPYSGTEGTLVVNMNTPVPSATTVRRIVLLSEGNAATNSNQIYWYASSVGASTTVGGTDQANVLVAYTPSTVSKLAYGFKANDFQFCKDGTLATPDTTGTVPSGIDTMHIGSVNGGGLLNGHVRQITYLPRRISNTELQSRTA